MKQNLKMGGTEWALLLVLSVLWGGSFFFAKISLAELPPLTLVFLRVSIAGVALGLLLKALGKRLPAGRPLWAAFFVMGFINNLVPFTLLFWGQTYIGAGLASIFTAMVPAFTVLVAHAFTSDEKLTAGKLTGVLLGTAGVAVMIGVDIQSGVDRWTILAMLACVGAAFSYGLASVFGRRFHAQRQEPLSVAFGQVTATAIMMLPLMILFDQPWRLPLPGLRTMAATGALALFCTALAYIIFFRILARGGATNISLVTFLIPVSAILLGMIFLGETLNPNHLAGMLLILIGLAALDGRMAGRVRLALRAARA